MNTKKLRIIVRTALLVLALMLSTTALAGTLGYYNWSANTTGVVGEFTNTGTGGGVKANTIGSASIGVYGYATGSSAQGTRGYDTSTGYGVYGRSVKGTGVYGENNGTTAGYGGFFTGFNGLKGYTTKANGYAGWFTAAGDTGFGVRAQSTGPNGYGVYSTGTFAGVRGEGIEGVFGVSTTGGGDALEASASGTNTWGVNAYANGQSGHAVVGNAYGSSSYGGKFYSSQYRGLYAEGSGGNYDLYAPHSAYIGGTVIPPKGGLALMARNDGTTRLEAGDLVVFRGFDPAVLSEGVVSAAKAGMAPGVVVGVVRGAYVLDETAGAVVLPAAPVSVPPVLQENTLVPPAPVPEGEEPRAEDEATVSASSLAAAQQAQPLKPSVVEPASGRFVEGSVEAGQYMVVSYLGLVQVRVTARTPIRAGDWIVVAPDGSVVGAPARSYSSSLDRGYTIVGRALEGLESGSGLIYVQLDLK